MSYFDVDRAAKGKNPEKVFFWGVLSTIRKEFTAQLLDEVNEKRMQQSI